jgi:tetratricopeptide (TPR) repeat protein
MNSCDVVVQEIVTWTPTWLFCFCLSVNCSRRHVAIPSVPGPTFVGLPTLRKQARMKISKLISFAVPRYRGSAKPLFPLMSFLKDFFRGSSPSQTSSSDTAPPKNTPKDGTISRHPPSSSHPPPLPPPVPAVKPPPLPAASIASGKGKFDELIKAAEQSDLGAINRALDAGIDVNGTDSEGWTALGTAASFGTVELVELLLTRGAKVDGRHANGETPLFHAARRGSVEIVQRLVDLGADVNAQDSNGHVPLNSALTNRKSVAHMQIIELFLSKGAKTDARDKSGWTPLHQAARNNNVSGAALLLRDGADVNARASDRRTPLHLHREEEQGDEGREMEEILLAAGGVAPGHDATVFHDEARSLHSLGRYEEAIRSYDQALAHDSESPDVWYNKGCVLDELDRLDEAIVCYDRAVKLDPRAADALNRMGVALGKLGDLDKQFVCFQKAVVADPRNTNSWSYLGGVLSKQGKHREALACYDELLALNSEDARAWFNKGITLAKLGIDAEALDCNDRACELDPSLEIPLADPRAQAIEDFFKRVVRPRRTPPS